MEITRCTAPTLDGRWKVLKKLNEVWFSSFGSWPCLSWRDPKEKPTRERRCDESLVCFDFRSWLLKLLCSDTDTWSHTSNTSNVLRNMHPIILGIIINLMPAHYAMRHAGCKASQHAVSLLASSLVSWCHSSWLLHHFMVVSSWS